MAFKDISRCCRLLSSLHYSWWYGPNFFKKEKDVLIIVAGLPAKWSCSFLETIKKDLIENLFDNECGDAVSFFSVSLLSTSIVSKTVQAHGVLRLSYPPCFQHHCWRRQFIPSKRRVCFHYLPNNHITHIKFQCPIWFYTIRLRQ